MAYDSSSSYDTKYGEYHQISNSDSYEFVSYHPLAADSGYGYNCYSFSENCVSPYYGPNDSYFSHSVVSYSASTLSDPKYMEYDPSVYGRNDAQTQFIVSYSVSEFNETEFEEYDPTPYGGGYDPTETYGKPLPPSEEICHPRSSVDADAVSLTNFSYGSIESPYGKEDTRKSSAPPETQNGAEPVGSNSKNGSHQEKDEKDHPNDCSPGTDSGVEQENRNIGDDATKYERRVPQIPPGYGLEAVDLCESLFGYWPCLSRIKRDHNIQAVCEERCSDNLWNDTADYLFGSSYPYGERWDIGGTYQEAIYAYQRHYQEGHLYRQTTYDGDPWLH